MADLRKAVVAALEARHAQLHDNDWGIATCAECSKVLAGWDAQQRAQDAPPSDPPPSPEPAAKTQGVRYPSPPSDAVHVGAPTVPTTTPEQLQAALEAAPDDAARARLLAGTSRDLRAKFNAMVVYQRMSVEDDPLTAKCAEFAARLTVAADDAERAAIIAATDRALVAEWHWQQDATVDDWRERYLTYCGESDPG